MSEIPTESRQPATHLWRHRGQARPPFAIVPGAGQESVWDYPRPPVLVADPRLVEVRLGAVGGELGGEREIASTRRALRVLETASPPTFYLPRADVRMELLVPTPRRSFCEWKGQASYFDAGSGPDAIPAAAWSYEDPTAAFAAIRGHIAFYPGRLACYIDGERVRAQAGGFYGGWITGEIVGPFKGEPGTGGW